MDGRAIRRTVQLHCMTTGCAELTVTVVDDIIYKGKRSKQQAEPLVPHLTPSRPYYNVGADQFDFQGKSHIVVTDYSSNYPEVATLQTPSSKAVIAFMKSVFARHRDPCIVFTDNGPMVPEFQQFSIEWDFQHNTSSPNYPRSNGLAESSVKIVKILMKKAHDGKEDFVKSLMIYRSAPNGEWIVTCSDADGKKNSSKPSDSRRSTHHFTLY
ncbi:hypothetical protein SRHO_G00270860 [Serrasalmus rhombeus]